MSEAIINYYYTAGLVQPKKTTFFTNFNLYIYTRCSIGSVSPTWFCYISPSYHVKQDFLCYIYAFLKQHGSKQCFAVSLVLHDMRCRKAWILPSHTRPNIHLGTRLLLTWTYGFRFSRSISMSPRARRFPFGGGFESILCLRVSYTCV